MVIRYLFILPRGQIRRQIPDIIRKSRLRRGHALGQLLFELVFHFIRAVGKYVLIEWPA